jgi:hypothetical protein
MNTDQMEEQFGVRIPRRSVTKMHLAPTSLKCMAFITAIQCPSFGKKKRGDIANPVFNQYSSSKI